MSGKRIKKWSVCYQQTVMYDNYEYIAEHFDLLDTSQSSMPNPAYPAAEIKAINPNIKILRYRAMRGSQPADPDWDIKNDGSPEHEAFFLHNNAAQRLQRCGLWEAYLMNTDLAKGYVAYQADYCAQFLQDYPMYDGIFGDTAHRLVHMVQGVPKWCISGTTTGVPVENFENYPEILEGWPCYPRWSEPGEWMHQMVGGIKNSIGNKIILPNCGADYALSGAAGWECYEGFIHAPGKLRDDMGWGEGIARTRLNELHALAKTGINIAVISGSSQSGTGYTLEEWNTNCYCFFALIIDNPDKSWYAWNFCHHDPSMGWWPIMDIELGDPIDDYTDIDELKMPDTDVYVRRFDNATVAANLSTTETYVVNINDTEYTFEPRRGIIIDMQPAIVIDDTKEFTIDILPQNMEDFLTYEISDADTTSCPNNPAPYLSVTSNVINEINMQSSPTAYLRKQVDLLDFSIWFKINLANIEGGAYTGLIHLCNDITSVTRATAKTNLDGIGLYLVQNGTDPNDLTQRYFTLWDYQNEVGNSFCFTHEGCPPGGGDILEGNTYVINFYRHTSTQMLRCDIYDETGENLLFFRTLENTPMIPYTYLLPISSRGSAGCENSITLSLSELIIDIP